MFSCKFVGSRVHYFLSLLGKNSYYGLLCLPHNKVVHLSLYLSVVSLSHVICFCDIWRWTTTLCVDALAGINLHQVKEDDEQTPNVGKMEPWLVMVWETPYMSEMSSGLWTEIHQLPSCNPAETPSQHLMRVKLQTKINKRVLHFYFHIFLL